MNRQGEKISIRKATTPEALHSIEVLARIIWEEHYTPIIGADQVRYMVENFQTATAMEKQIRDGMDYYQVFSGEAPIGYLAFKEQGRELFLSKIYILSSLRGRGMGRKAMEFVEDQARNRGCQGISLTVNKNNSKAIGAYEKMGFVNQGHLETDIGGGFIMDDYLMKKEL